LVEGARATVESRRAPDRRPAEGETVPRGAVGKQHVAFAVQAEHAEQSGEIAATGIALLGIAFRPHPRHRVVGVIIRFDHGHRRIPVGGCWIQISGFIAFLRSSRSLMPKTSASQSAINSWPMVGLSCWQ